MRARLIANICPTHVKPFERLYSVQLSTGKGNLPSIASKPNCVVTAISNMDIDLRSDTFTKPTTQMYESMVKAPVGDDVFQEDPTVKQLEEKVANLLGKEAGLFVVSGTMGNLLCMMAHCWGRGYDVIVGDKSHIFKYEQGGVSHIAGAMLKTIPNQPDGTIALGDIAARITSSTNENPHFTRTRVVCLENTQNVCGGVALSPQYCKDVSQLVKHQGIALHLDGARLLNAAVYLNVDPRVLTEHFDSVNLCLSKGLGAPVGSVICGSSVFIDRARRLRKMLGGGWRQAGVLAACGLTALEDYDVKLRSDHANAKLFADIISQVEDIFVDKNTVQTNMVYFKVSPDRIGASLLVEKLEKKSARPDGSTEESVGVIPISETTIRAVFHHQITSQQVRSAAEKIVSTLTS